MTAPTAQMRCFSPEKAAELAERLRSVNGVPAALASCDGDMLRAPIDDIGFAFALVASAVEEGFADDDDAGDFQQAAIDHAQGRPSTRQIGMFCDSCRARFEADVPGRTREEAFESIRKLATEKGWSIGSGADLCADCTTVELLGRTPTVFWVCPVPEHRGSFLDLIAGQEPAEVRWVQGIAHCMAPGCSRTSRDEAASTCVDVGAPDEIGVSDTGEGGHQ